MLRAHVRDGQVDYAALSKDRKALQSLDAFLKEVAAMPESAPMASWLNAYNALVVASVVEHYPLKSVRDVKGFFDKARHRVAGKLRTLDQIENRIIRPRFNDARIHFALNCGARGCPALHDKAFRTKGLDRTLDRLARNAMQNPTHVRVQKGKRVAVSEIFFWFTEDFKKDGKNIVAWINAYRPPNSQLPESAELKRISYDWRLNQAR